MNEILETLPKVYKITDYVLPSKLEGIYAPTIDLSKLESGVSVDFEGFTMESPYFTADGTFYGITHDGFVIKRQPGESGAISIWADLGLVSKGLGLRMDAEGNMIIADALRGLLKVDKDTKKVEILAMRVTADQSPVIYADDLAIHSDGDVYFSTSCDTPPMVAPDGEVRADLTSKINVMQGHASGKLLRYTPSTGEVVELLHGLAFANGVELAPDESYVLVCETWKYRVRRYWLSGEKAGTSEIFVDGLPGFVDNIRYDESSNTYWTAIFTPPPPAIGILMKYPLVRKIALMLPPSLQPKKQLYGLAVQLDMSGKPIKSIHDPTGSLITQITCPTSYKGKLYLGSYTTPHIIVYDPSEAMK